MSICQSCIFHTPAPVIVHNPHHTLSAQYCAAMFLRNTSLNIWTLKWHSFSQSRDEVCEKRGVIVIRKNMYRLQPKVVIKNQKINNAVCETTYYTHISEQMVARSVSSGRRKVKQTHRPPQGGASWLICRKKDTGFLFNLSEADRKGTSPPFSSNSWKSAQL